MVDETFAKYIIEANGERDFREYAMLKRSLEMMVKLMNSVNPAASPLVIFRYDEVSTGLRRKRCTFWVEGAEHQITLLQDYIQGMLDE